MFDLDRFIADCRAAVSVDPTHKSVREIVARAIFGSVLLAICQVKHYPSP